MNTSAVLPIFTAILMNVAFEDFVTVSCSATNELMAGWSKHLRNEIIEAWAVFGKVIAERTRLY